MNEAFSDCLLSRRERRQRRRFLKIEVVCVWAADDGTEVRKRKRRLTQIPIPRKERKISTYGQRRAGQTVCSIAGASRTAERISNQMRPVKTAPTACWARKKEKNRRRSAAWKEATPFVQNAAAHTAPTRLKIIKTKKWILDCKLEAKIQKSLSSSEKNTQTQGSAERELRRVYYKAMSIKMPFLYAQSNV